MRGYFFSLEALIAIILLLGSVLILAPLPEHPQSQKEEKIYRAMSILERSGSLQNLSDEELKQELEKILGFDVEVNPKKNQGTFLNYLLVKSSSNFRIIRIAYQQT